MIVFQQRAVAARRPGDRRGSILVLILGLAFLAACGGPTPLPTPPLGLPTVLPTATVAVPATLAAPPTATPPAGSGALTPTPGPAAGAATATLPAIPEDQAVIIYTLVAHDLVLQSQATAPTPVPPVPTYIGISPQAGYGELLDTDSSTENIPDDLIDNLADLGTTVSFAAFEDAVGPLDEGGEVQDGGIYLTLGTLEPQGDVDHVALYASFYRATDDATGYRYTLAHTPGGPWAITNRQQVWDH